ncbi:MAG TPA: SRPBCC family protein, partial [Burkholderiales bacterium]|nr:SRPBCC family protein [Burkholderiales bacterium]
MRALKLVALLVPLLAAGGARANEVSIETQRRDSALEVVCRALLEAPAELVWQTLTDYDHLADFIPGMQRSRVIARSGRVATVEQLGTARFLFVSLPIEVTLATTEFPPRAIEAKMTKGNLRRLEGTYRIEPRADGRVLVSWQGLIEAEALPPLIGELLMRSAIADQFRGMVLEIERRDA